MKYLFVIALLFFAAESAEAQPWRDTLNAARKAYKSGDYQNSFKKYQSAQKLAPEGVDLSEESGQAAYRAGKYEEAKKLFARVEQRNQSMAQQSKASNNVGAAKMKAKDLKGAEESFKEALRKDPANEKARQNLAEVKRLQKQQQKQQQNSNQSNPNSQNPGNSQSRQNQQQSQQKQGNQQQNQQQNQNGQQQNQSSGGNEQPVNRNAPKLGDKQTERKLDELMKRERQTKRQMGGNQKSGNGESSSQDW